MFVLYTNSKQCQSSNIVEHLSSKPKFRYKTKSQPIFDATLQNFIYKKIVDLENVQRNKKKKKGEFIGC